MSPMKSKYRAMTNASEKLMWFETILARNWLDQIPPNIFSTNNQSAMALEKDVFQHQRTKCIEIYMLFV